MYAGHCGLLQQNDAVFAWDIARAFDESYYSCIMTGNTIITQS